MPALALAFPLQSFRLAGVQRADVGGTLRELHIPASSLHGCTGTKKRAQTAVIC